MCVDTDAIDCAIIVVGVVVWLVVVVCCVGVVLVDAVMIVSLMYGVSNDMCVLCCFVFLMCVLLTHTHVVVDYTVCVVLQ